jgi:hypothetical protein
MKESDRQDELYESLTLERVLVGAQSPPYGGYNGNHSTWIGYGYQWNVHGDDVVYLNKEGKKHRIYGPAYISINYDIEIWYKEGEYHRLDGPAIKHKKSFIWYKEGKLHRLDGPAVIEGGGPKQYWIDGRRLSPKEYKKEIARRKRKGLIK